MDGSTAMDELLAVSIIYRHGDRPPLLFYPTDPHKDSPIWTAAAGDLSNIGKKQMFELGQWLRQHYEDFLSASYKKNELYVVSSDDDRCIASASANLAGLFPPKQEDIWNPDLLWQPIPVHTLPKECDTLINSWNHIFKSRQFMSIFSSFETKENERLYEYLSTHSGIKNCHFMEALYIWDALFIEEFNNLPLPEWTKQVYPLKLNKLHEEFFSELSSNKEINKLIVGRLLHEVLQQFTSFAPQPPVKPNEPKLRIYSAHDLNVQVILELLEVPHSMDIPFAAALLFELRRMTTGELFVQLVYKTSETDISPHKNISSQWGYENFQNILRHSSLTEEEYLALVP